MTDIAVAGLVAGYGVAIPVGAIALLIVSLSARTSIRVGAAAGLGVATADGIFALLAVAGGAALARLLEPVTTPLRWIAAAVLIGLSIRTAITAVRSHQVANPAGTGLSSPPRAYAVLVGLTLLNPTTIIYFGAMVLGRQGTSALGLVDGGIFVLAAFLASASWQLLLAGGGSLIGRLLTTPRGQLTTALVSSAVIAALAVHLVLST